MVAPLSALDALHSTYEQIGNLRHASQYLSWDEAVNLSKQGGDARAEALATLEQLIHEQVTSNRTGDLLEAAREDASDPWELANIRVIEHERKRACGIPSELVVALSRATSMCELAWRGKRKENDWEGIAPSLTEVFDLTRQRAEALATTLNIGLYDALLDEYEPGLRQEFIDPVFSDLLEFLPDFVDRTISRQQECLSLNGSYSPSAQLKLGEALMHRLGFDFDRGRIDTSDHPFSCGDRTDTRITTRFGNDNFFESMYAVVHETGHAMYQQGLPKEWHAQPVGQSLGMMLHESQSLFVEKQICRSRAFLEFVLPVVKESLGISENSEAWSLDNFIRCAHKIERGKIRVDADECTYPLHVVLRYQLEKSLIENTMSVRDIPDAWNDLMQKYLRVSTENDYYSGCMQDVHWFAGLIGYFPCYSLGAVTAAQWFEALKREVADVEAQYRAGEFDTTLAWLRKNIHSQGQLIPSFELIEKVTGKPLSSDAFVSHLCTRYG